MCYLRVALEEPVPGEELAHMQVEKVDVARRKGALPLLSCVKLKESQGAGDIGCVILSS